MTVAAASPVRATQDATPAGMQSEHLEVIFTPVDPVSITLAGSGPPQRGDHFYIDGPIYAVDDLDGTQIGTYQCFGAWTAASTATDAPNQRLTTIQFLFEDGSIMALINEGGVDSDAHVGAVQGGAGRYAHATGTFQQISEEGTMATPDAAATPVPDRNVVRAVFELMLPAQG
jgi:hypothetical protein